MNDPSYYDAVSAIREALSLVSSKTEQSHDQLYELCVANYRKCFEKLKQSANGKHSRIVFDHMIELHATALTQTYEQSEEKEKEWVKLASHYDSTALAQCMAYLSMAFSLSPATWSDFIGQFFMDSEFYNVQRGEYFTPMHVANMMAGVTLQNHVEIIDQKGYISINDPACGAGAMLIACARLVAKTHEVSRVALFVGTDVNITCARMTYLQLCAMNVPAVIHHGNTLTGETFYTMYSPAFLRDTQWIHRYGALSK